MQGLKKNCDRLFDQQSAKPIEAKAGAEADTLFSNWSARVNGPRTTMPGASNDVFVDLAYAYNWGEVNATLDRGEANVDDYDGVRATEPHFTRPLPPTPFVPAAVRMYRPTCGG